MPADLRFAEVFRWLPALYLVVDPALIIVAATDSYLRATMTTREQLIGRRLFDAFPDNPAEPAATGVANLHASLQRVLVTGSADVMPVQKYDIRRPDGTFEDRYWSPRNTPVFDAGGVVSYIVHEVEDVTASVLGGRRQARNAAALAAHQELLRVSRREARAAEARLADAQARLELTLAASEVGTWLWDAVEDRVVADPNLARMFGMSAAGGASARLADFLAAVHPDDRGRVEATIASTLARGESYELEYQIALPDGMTRYLLARGRPECDHRGHVVGLHGVALDITDRVIAERARAQLAAQVEQRNAELLEVERSARADAERVNRLKDDFLATLSHELRTPLNSILGWAEFLEADDVDPAYLREGLAAISRNAQVQAEMIADLLDLSRIIAGKLQLTLSPVPLTEILLQTLQSLHPVAAARGVVLEPLVSTAPVMVLAAADRLRQIFWNVIANAIKFTPAGGEVRVELRTTSGSVEVSVTDTGQGIDAAFLPHVFERFRQADSASTRKHGGLGIGLSIVRQLVELHGGRVSATSRGAGHGAQFVVTLPQGLSAPPAAATVRPSGDGHRFDSVRVLVVDDDRDTRTLMERIFASREASVLTAASAAEALQVVRTHSVDLLICDVGMPGRDGYDLVRELRTLQSTPSGAIPAVAVTAHARPEDRRRALAAGFQAHLTKPIQQAELLRVCGALIEGR